MLQILGNFALWSDKLLLVDIFPWIPRKFWHNQMTICRLSSKMLQICGSFRHCKKSYASSNVAHRQISHEFLRNFCDFWHCPTKVLEFPREIFISLPECWKILGKLNTIKLWVFACWQVSHEFLGNFDIIKWQPVAYLQKRHKFVGFFFWASVVEWLTLRLLSIGCLWVSVVEWLSLSCCCQLVVSQPSLLRL